MRVLSVVGVGLAALVVFAASALAGFQIATSSRIIPGVTVLGLTAGGLTVEEAQAQLGPRTAAILDQPLQLQVGERTWTTSPRELGVPLDPSDLAHSAFAVGHQGGVFNSLSAKLETLGRGQDVSIAEAADGARLDALLALIAGQIQTPAKAAQLSLGDDGTLTFSPSQTGLELDQAASRSVVVQALASGAPTASLVTRTLAPSLGTEQVAAAHEQLARVFTGQPVQLSAAEHRYTLAPTDVRHLVSLDVPSGPGATASVSVDQDAVQSWLDRIASEVDQPATDARFALSGGQLSVLRPSHDGRGLDQTAAHDQLVTQLLAGEHTIQLPVNPVHAAVSSDDGGASLNFHDLIDESTTSFAGSIPEKAHNIRLAAERLNGVVVPPGGMFSFNKEVGPTTIEAGFQWGFGLTTGSQGGVHTVPSVAGGICQVATTLFQPVFWAGYQLEERYWHLYWIPSYTSRGIVGLDATVDSDAGLDLKWINPTKSPVLIQSSTDAEHVTFRLYGIKPAWNVNVEQPVISDRVTPDTTPDVQEEPLLPWGRVIPVETARDGFQVVITRHVVPTDGSSPRDLVLKSIYQPGHNVTLVGTGAAPDGASVTAAVDRVRASLQGSSSPSASAPAPAAAAAPKPTPAPSTIETPNGPKTLAQIRDELRRAGWGGGSDQDAEATYNRVAGAAKSGQSDSSGN